MGFLAKLGPILLKVIGVVSGIVPLIQPVLPQHVGDEVKKVSDDLTKVGQVVITVEQMFANAFGPDAKRGSEKLQASVPFIAQIIQQSELVAGHKVADEAKFIKACEAITSGMADVLSSLEAKEK